MLLKKTQIAFFFEIESRLLTRMFYMLIGWQIITISFCTFSQTHRHFCYHFFMPFVSLSSHHYLKEKHFNIL